MIEPLQRIYDWYICGPREFYRKYIDRFWQRRGLIAVSGGHGFLDMDPLPLGYSVLDDKLREATKRQYDRIAKNISD
ncbi:hypothetical protein KY345_04960 [Candidatus Woesearchaeota archaeon]|nr:hypothetical protein [Candidatus Woesearchaeota archaeon]